MKEFIQEWFIHFPFVVLFMAVGYWLGTWSKIKKGKKPLLWWFHKVLCEFGWLIRNYDNRKMYYSQLDNCIKLGFNFYGEPIKKAK
jgi:hypothetical protein